MRKSSFMVLIAFLAAAVTAYAGAPLKGVDVKLGKNPGGGMAARATNAEGKADFGVLPAGEYAVTISVPKAGTQPPEAQIEVRGPSSGTITKRCDFAQKKAFDANTAATAKAAGESKIVFKSDGVHPITIAATAVVRAKSNISNN
jgi:hypothetical protein